MMKARLDIFRSSSMHKRWAGAPKWSHTAGDQRKLPLQDIARLEVWAFCMFCCIFSLLFAFPFIPAKASRVGKNSLKRHPGSEWFLFYRPSYSHFLVYYGLPDLLDPSQAQQILVYSTNPSNFQPQLCAVRNRAETVPILRAEL